MRRYSKSRGCDIKTFLERDRHSTGFFAFTLRFAPLKATLCFAFFSILIFCFALWGVQKTELMYFSMSRASVLFECVHKDNIPLSQRIVMGAAAPFFKVVQDVEDSPPEIALPKVNIKEESYPSNGVDIKNETQYNIDVASLLLEEAGKFESSPKVLIVHTHGSESYTPTKKYSYVSSGNYRTQDKAYNVVRVGEEVAKALEDEGIEVIHDKTINDYPSYNDSYNKTEKIIKKHLEADKDIAFVFDIHRDAIGDEDNVVKLTAEVGGKTAAQVMIVCGSDTNLENPNWMDNLSLAVHIQNEFQRDYPGFMRPINLRKERFNMHLTKGSILFEVGTSGNTLEEALVSARYLGEGLGKYIKNHMK